MSNMQILPIYQPWDPRRVNYIHDNFNRGTPLDLIIQLEDHPTLATAHSLYHPAQTTLDLNALISLIEELSSKAKQAQIQNGRSSKNLLPFTCHLYTAPDPLSSSWLDTTIKLLKLTEDLAVQWSIFTDGQNWDHADLNKSYLAECIHRNRLNVILYADCYRTSDVANSLRPEEVQIASNMIRRRKKLYTLAKLLPPPKKGAGND